MRLSSAASSVATSTAMSAICAAEYSPREISSRSNAVDISTRISPNGAPLTSNGSVT